MAPAITHTRRQAIPTINVKGTHYDVGYDIGRSFGSIIHSYINTSYELNQIHIPLYETEVGKRNYNKLLENATKYYPQYVKELQGMSAGANIPFFKLFLLQLGDLLPFTGSRNSSHDQGCTTICLNETGQELIGHTEDGLKDVLNHLYIVNANIIDSEHNEVFTALCYAGLLPGYSMGFNKHGFIFTINIIHAKNLNLNGIPRTFVARALLAADTFQKIETILQCKGIGIADAMSVNFTFLHEAGDRLIHNLEVGPSNNPSVNSESCMSILTISPGERILHCNKLLHLLLQEDETYHDSSYTRHKTMDTFGKITNKQDILKLLGDTSHPLHNIFRDGNGDILTVAVAIFDLVNKTWSVYVENPKTSQPIITMPLDFAG